MTNDRFALYNLQRKHRGAHPLYPAEQFSPEDFSVGKGCAPFPYMCKWHGKASAMEIRNAAVQEALVRLTEKYNELCNQLVVLSETGTFKKMPQLWSIGHWGMGKGFEIKEEYGTKTVRGQIFHAHGDNIEGSLYVAWDENVLRIRWEGEVALYLNSNASYVHVSWSDSRYVLTPLRIGDEWERISEVEEDRVRIQTMAERDYEHLVWVRRREYEDRVREARALPSKTRRMIARLFGQEAVEPSLVLPEPPPRVYRSITELVSMLDTMRDGIERTIDILALFVPVPA